jgi:MoaA/NifB/PqqE/SkfB family radical SAM enzyme
VIKIAQISPFDKCNNKCWYCPVRYYEQPTQAMIHMKPELFEKIIKELIDNKGGLVSDRFDFIYTAHYNEILLYKYLPEMLEILRKYGVKTMILSNGVAFLEDKIELIDKYRDVVIGINFNIPAFEKEVWEDYTGNTGFEHTMNNVKNVFEKFGAMTSIVVNGMDAAKTINQVEMGKKLFPGLNIYPGIGLSDRAGTLHDKGVISNREEIERNKQGKSKIVGCRNSERFTDWLHVNSIGQVFLCCNDYFFEHILGDLNTQSLKEIMASDQRREEIKKACSGICTKCSMAIWE